MSTANERNYPEVEVFRRLVESRRKNDRSQIQPLTVELRRLGWQVLAIATRPSNRRADR